MLIEVINRAEQAVSDMPSAAGRGAAASSGFRRGLRRSKAITSKLSAFQTAAAACVAATERHGDGGTHIPADTAGLTRSDTHGRIKLEHWLGRPAPSIFHEISTSNRKA